jgi:hypothetical protein
MGFNNPPHGLGISLLDIRGVLDNTVPANVSNGWPAPWLPGQVTPGPHNSSLSGDGFYYTPIDNITATFGSALRCQVRRVSFPAGWAHLQPVKVFTREVDVAHSREPATSATTRRGSMGSRASTAWRRWAVRDFGFDFASPSFGATVIGIGILVIL